MKRKVTIVGFIGIIILITVALLISQPTESLSAAPPEQALRRYGDFFVEAAAGNIRDHSIVDKFGRNNDVDSGAAEDIWDGGGTWNEPSAAQVYTITSTSTADTAAGTGARTLEIFGLDGDGALANETVTLAGTGWVTPTTQYQMIHRMVVRTAGSGGSNAGTITANATVDGTITAQMTIGFNQTLMAIYKIPAGKKGCLHRYSAGINRNVTNGSADIFLYAKPTGEVWQIKEFEGIVAAGNSSFSYNIGPDCLDPLTLIKVSSQPSADNTDTSAGFTLVLIPD